ncbi:MAG: lysophospholipase L1-like esterase [Planctomycetota bacterium]|jgi:lysophospholipase L1-like esterase
MNKLLRNSIAAVSTATILAACGADISNSVGGGTPSSGSADFSTFVSVGDSLTAGYADGALYRDGQLNSYPAILAQQFAKVGGGAFTQPLMPVGGTGSLSITGIGAIPGIRDRLVLVPTGKPTSPVGPFAITPVVTSSIDTRVGAGGFNNTGVPGAKSFHLPTPGYGAVSAAAIGAGSVNPFFARFSSSDGTTVLTDALAQTPSFFVLWIGNNDILSYATGGGVGVDQTGNADVSTYGAEDITDPGYFATGGTGAATGLPGYPGIAGALAAGGAKGVLVNIPNVSTIPYFTTIPFMSIPLDAAQVAGLQAALGDPYNAGLDAAVVGVAITQVEADSRYLNFVVGINPVLIFDEDLTNIGAGQMRFATADDYIVLLASPKIGVDSAGMYGISVPLADLDVLTATEAAAVQTASTAYNATIKATADASADLLLFDASAVLAELNETGLFYGTGGITSQFAQGGGFSLDGVHPTARGYAVIANLIIDTINTGFGATIPKVDPGQYSTVFYQ